MLLQLLLLLLVGAVGAEEVVAEHSLVSFTTATLLRNPATLKVKYLEVDDNGNPTACPNDYPVACFKTKDSPAKCCPLQIDGSRDPSVCASTANVKCLKVKQRKHPKRKHGATWVEIIFFVFIGILAFVVCMKV